MKRSRKPAKPRWDEATGKLSWLGQLLRQFRPDASNQRRILDAFEQQAWRNPLDNPLPRTDGIDRKQRLRQTIKRLNCGQKPPRIRFHTNRKGQIWWEAIT